MNRSPTLILSAIVLLAMLGGALFWYRGDSVAEVRRATPSAPDSAPTPAAPSLTSDPPPTDKATPPPSTSTVPPANETGKVPPQGVLPQNVQSYLTGRTPDEIRPDGSQVFKNIPFYVKQKDGSMAIQPSTITVTPTAARPVLDEDALEKKEAGATPASSTPPKKDPG